MELHGSGILQISAKSRVFEGHTEGIVSVALTPDGRWALTGSNDNTGLLWNLRNPDSRPRVLSGHTNSIFSVALTPDGTWALTGSRDNNCTSLGSFKSWK